MPAKKQADPSVTTITIKKSTRQRLENLKVHPRQSFGEVLEKLMSEGRL